MTLARYLTPPFRADEGVEIDSTTLSEREAKRFRLHFPLILLVFLFLAESPEIRRGVFWGLEVEQNTAVQALNKAWCAI